MNTESLKKKLKQKTVETQPVIPDESLLSTGSTLANLAASGRTTGAYYKGGYFLLVGDSDSGKTVLTMTVFAEAANNKNFDAYRLIHDNAEGGALMNVEEFFGRRMAERIEPPPAGTSEWAEDFYYNLDDLYKQQQPFIYILDSMDSIDSREDAELLQGQKKARREGKEVPGGYGTAKARLNSQGLRRAMTQLPKTGSILIVVSQTRDNIGGMGFGPQKTRSGGRALRFYSRLEMWTSTVKQLKKTVNKIPRQIGIQCKLDVKKNHINGNKGSVEFPIYNSFGIDDVGSCIDFLVTNSHWKKNLSSIAAPELDYEGTRNGLIDLIEEENKESELRKITAGVWKQIEEKCRVKRRKRYE